MLAVIETHPIQYHAPIYRILQQRMGIPVTAIYGSDFSVAGYQDKEFGAEFAWDTDLLSGYKSIFLSRVSEGGARSSFELVSDGLGKALKAVKPEAILLGGYSSRFDRKALVCALRGNYPIFFRGETTDHARRRNVVKSRIRDLLLRQLYSKCTKLLFIGEHSYKHYKRLGCPDEKLIFSPYCVNVSPFSLSEESHKSLRLETRRSLGIEQSQVALLFSGKLSPRKGPDLLLNAIKELSIEQRDGIVLLFLGSGYLQNELEQLANSSPAVRTVFLGFKNQSQLSPFYHAADLLVVPSRHSETWGLVVNDALHHGLPCVVSDMTGCAPDLIRPSKTGEVFESDSINSLTLALERAFKLINRDEIRGRCLQVVEGYTTEQAAEGIAKAYLAVKHKGIRSCGTEGISSAA